MGTMMQGMAFGAGSEVAHNVVGSFMGRGQHQEQQQMPQQTQQANNMCQTENSNLVDWWKMNSKDIQGCQSFLDLLKSCEQRFN